MCADVSLICCFLYEICICRHILTIYLFLDPCPVSQRAKMRSKLKNRSCSSPKRECTCGHFCNLFFAAMTKVHCRPLSGVYTPIVTSWNMKKTTIYRGSNHFFVLGPLVMFVGLQDP